MTPIQSQALDLLAWLFIWTVRLIGSVLIFAMLVGFWALIFGAFPGR